MKGKTNNSSMIIGNFNALFSIMVRISREIIEKEIANLNNTINQRDLSYICEILHTLTIEYIFPRVGYIL